MLKCISLVYIVVHDARLAALIKACMKLHADCQVRGSSAAQQAHIYAQGQSNVPNTPLALLHVCDCMHST